MSKYQALIDSAPWYSVSRCGAATLCTGQDDAIATATDSQTLYPRNGPYEATQLVPVATIRALLADLERAEKALREVVAVFDSNPSSIVDTVWVTGNRPETLYDHCQAALAQMAKGE